MAKISVCIPTYNYGHYIGEAVESVLTQTCVDFELVISDNASTDDTSAIIERFRCRDPRVSYHRNERNIGMVGNWNRCLELAAGEYFLLLCADDLLEQGCLERLAGLLDSYPEAALAACARGIQVEGRIDSYLGWADRECYLPAAEAMRLLLLRGNIVGEPTAAMFRRDLGRRGFCADYAQLTDLEMWYHLFGCGGFAYAPEILCRYRQHAEQETVGNVRSLRLLTEGRRLYRDYSRSPGVRLSAVERFWACCRPLLACLYAAVVTRFSRGNRRAGQRRLAAAARLGT